MKKELLERYAKAIVRVGGNVREGQEVFITASVKNYEFALLVIEECYKAGAKQVFVDWKCEEATNLDFKYASVETLSNVTPFLKEEWKYKVNNLSVLIWLSSDNPDAFASIDPNKLMSVSSANRRTIRAIRKPADNRYQWIIAACPSNEWAHKLFPEMNTEDAVEKLWEVIIKCARCDEEDPVEQWNKHNKFIKDKCAWLNSLNIDYLEYKSSNGTDFKVGLHKEGQFVGGKSYTLSGIYYNPNMPSEECFTSPVKESAQGVVFAGKPLCLNGVVLENFGFRFKDGKVIEVLAKDQNTKDMLEGLVNTDDGARMLGEVALVSFDSPINQSGILFYETLFDENACCHLALGYGFQDAIKDYEKLSSEELDKVGINQSAIHVDFMIGTRDLSIIATLRDGSKKTIFTNGTWVE